MKHKKAKSKSEVVRVNGKLKRITTIKDKAGKIIGKTVSPLMTEFYAHDVIQIFIGASILAVPVAFTQEVWDLGIVLPWINTFAIMAMSLVFISSFVYYHYYQNNFKKNWEHFLIRVSTTYFLSAVVVAVILTLVQAAPWTINWSLALKRIIIVNLPASMSAAVSDVLK